MKKKKDNKGFTLIEVVIAVVILAIVVSPFVGNFIQSSKMNLESRKNLNAMTLAQDMIEGMSSYNATDLLDVLKKADTETIENKILPSGATYTQSSSGENASLSSGKKHVYDIKGVQTAAGTYNQ